MNENDEMNSIYSWPVIIVAFIFFWPVGIFLLIKRLSFNKNINGIIGRIFNILGIAPYAIAGIGIIACLMEGFGKDDIILISMFALIGYCLRRVGKSYIKESEIIEQYKSIIYSGNVRTINEIANITGKSVETVEKELQKYISKGYIPGAYINMVTKEIVLSKDMNIINQNKENVKRIKAKVVICNCCGAKNIVEIEDAKCEYCKMPLEN
ncbi:MAG: hypothetical protein E7311_04590 [Clostridiales bacterium]|nr:hypothetical protein [Clostridiales bacterium]